MKVLELAKEILVHVEASKATMDEKIAAVESALAALKTMPDFVI
jgi:hypothetical protein